MELQEKIKLIDNYINQTRDYVKRVLISYKECYIKSNHTLFSNLTPIQLRLIIKRLRLDGMLIIADKNGYMYTENEDKIKKYIAKRRYELNAEHQVLKVLENKYINKNQEKLF